MCARSTALHLFFFTHCGSWFGYRVHYTEIILCFSVFSIFSLGSAAVCAVVFPFGLTCVSCCACVSIFSCFPYVARHIHQRFRGPTLRVHCLCFCVYWREAVRDTSACVLWHAL